MATVQINLKPKEMERYLESMNLYKVWNDLMYPPYYMNEGELNSTLKSVYARLEEIHCKAFPYTMRNIAAKGSPKFEFKNEAEFEKGFGEYFEKRLVSACFREMAKHPKYTRERISEIVTKQAPEIFEQSIAYVFNELTYIIQERKIAYGQEPFDFI